MVSTICKRERDPKPAKKLPPGGRQNVLPKRRYKCQRVAKWCNNGYLNFLRGYRMRHCGFLSPVDMVRYGARSWRKLSPEIKLLYKIKPSGLMPNRKRCGCGRIHRQQKPTKFRKPRRIYRAESFKPGLPKAKGQLKAAASSNGCVTYSNGSSEQLLLEASEPLFLAIERLLKAAAERLLMNDAILKKPLPDMPDEA